jgi:hypothetical protein
MPIFMGGIVDIFSMASTRKIQRLLGKSAGKTKPSVKGA